MKLQNIVPPQPQKFMVRIKARKTFRALSAWCTMGVATYLVFPNEYPAGLFYSVGAVMLITWIRFLRTETPQEVSEFQNEPPVIHWA